MERERVTGQDRSKSKNGWEIIKDEDGSVMCNFQLRTARLA